MASTVTLHPHIKKHNRSRHKMKISYGLILTTTLAIASFFAHGKTVPDRAKVEALIHNMLSKKVRELELPEQKNAMKNCEYLHIIFESHLISKDATYCNITGNVPVRFPNIYDEDLSDLARSGTVPRSRILTISVRGEKAVVKVQTPIAEDLTPARMVYFLRKSEGQWRIYNILAYFQWPLNLSGEFRNCRGLIGPTYEFAREPQGPDEIEDLPTPCQANALNYYTRNGWPK